MSTVASKIEKVEKDLCRCCHIEGDFKSLYAPYYCRLKVGNEKVVYSEMLLECFNLELVTASEPINHMICGICNLCIQKLYDALLFKRQVQKCEKQFRDVYMEHICKASATCDLPIKEEMIDLADCNEEKLSVECLNGVIKDDFDSSKLYDGRMADDDDDDGRMADDDRLHSDQGSDTGCKLNEEEYRAPPRRKRGPYKKKKGAKTKVKKKNKPRTKTVAPPKSTDIVDTIAGTQIAEYVTEKQGNDKIFKCKACEVTFKRIYDLRYHVIRSHLKQKVIKCRLCSESFMYQRKTHMYSAHTLQKPASFQCDLCHRQFKRKNTLVEHMLDLHIDKKCLQCDLRFTRKKFLFHMNEAHGSPMPTCGVCGLRTLLQSSLVRHQRNVHLNEKNKSCTVCSKSFYSESNLKDHMVSHSGSKAYECEVCAKSFSRKECYRTHCRRHARVGEAQAKLISDGATIAGACH